jgi:acetyl esterase/lipase
MHRLFRMSFLVVLIAVPAAARGAAPPAGAQDAAVHPLVGAWVLDVDIESVDDPPIYLLLHADGTLLVANPYYGEGVGAWRPTGGRTADATVVFQDLNPDPTQVVIGTLTASLAIEVGATGDAFAARIASEGRWPDGTLAERDGSTARGTRLAVQPLPVSTTPVAAEPAAPPAQPAPPPTGPGSDNTPFPAARATKYGPDPGGFWLWEPTIGAAADAPVAAGPFPVLLYVDGCCVGDYPNPPSVGLWLTHLARQGYVVVAPVYRATTVLVDVPARLREALAELARPGHAGIDLTRFAVAGYSFGGVPAVVYAATAAAAGLPVPQALFVMAPCLDGSLSIGATPGSPCQVPPTNPAFQPGLKAVVLAFGQDFRVGIDMPRQVFGALSSLPAADRDFVVMASDGHGQPPVLAQHETPVDGVDAADWYGIWKLSDALFACAVDGPWCEYALGNTPEQRFMGIWSDGVPVAELTVTAGPAASGS